MEQISPQITPTDSNTNKNDDAELRKHHDIGHDTDSGVDHAVERVHHVEEIHSPDDIIIYTAENRVESVFLTLRNIFVVVAFVLFTLTRLPVGFASSQINTLRIVGYFIGAAAYTCEIMILTDFFRRKHNPREMFLPYGFGAMYCLLGISYIVF